MRILVVPEHRLGQGTQVGLYAQLRNRNRDALNHASLAADTLRHRYPTEENGRVTFGIETDPQWKAPIAVEGQVLI